MKKKPRCKQRGQSDREEVMPLRNIRRAKGTDIPSAEVLRMYFATVRHDGHAGLGGKDHE